MEKLRCINIGTVPIYKPVIEGKNKYCIIKGGRDTGKSVVAIQKLLIDLIKYPRHDAIVCRDSYSDLTDSDYAEIESFIEENQLGRFFRCTKSPLRIRRRDGLGSIYFFGIGGADKSRTKSVKTKFPVIRIVFEELQQVKDEESLYQAHASFRRRLDPNNWLMIHLFNPPPQKAHWVNVWAEMKKLDRDYEVIHSTYLDILPFLNDVDLKEILKMKIFEPEKYDWLYMGIAGGGIGSVYPQYKREKHFISERQAGMKFHGQRIIGVIIGCDGAVNRDATCFAPQAIFSNGQSAFLEPFYHDPKKSGVKSSSEICEYASMWFWSTIVDHHGLGRTKNDRFLVPICFKVDSAAADLKRELLRWFGNRAFVESFSKSSVVEMVGVVQSAIARNMVYVIDYGGYYDYILSKFVTCDNPITVAFENLVWNEKGDNYDPIVPNDASDAATYAICTYYKNPDNLNWLAAIIQNRQEFYEISFKKEEKI